MTKQYLTPEQRTLPSRLSADDELIEGDSPSLQDVKVVSLEIDENDDYGTDPYNCTGSFAVPNFRED